MNSLEFIEKEIEFLEDMISMDVSLVEDDFDLQEIYKKQQRLRHLKQIKAELEAWEVIKKCIIDSSGVYLLRIDSDDEDDEEYYKILKKALEIRKEI